MVLNGNNQEVGQFVDGVLTQLSIVGCTWNKTNPDRIEDRYEIVSTQEVLRDIAKLLFAALGVTNPNVDLKKPIQIMVVRRSSVAEIFVRPL